MDRAPQEAFHLEAEADRRLAALEVLFLSDATLSAYGEGLSVRAHMLQAAELAVRSELAPSLVAAALLHDLGWVLPGAPHEVTAAEHLAPLFGSAVATPVRLHVAAKRYLVAAEPDYFDRLSQASRDTLRLQGGPMDAGERRAFEDTPGAADALVLRRIDEAAKDPAGAATPFAAYCGLLKDLILRELVRSSAGPAPP